MTAPDPLECWHVGPWTTRGTRPGEPRQPGVRRTPDELNFDVVGLARILGRRLSGRDELQVRLWQNELRPTHTRMCGVHSLADPASSRLLSDTARQAFEWLAARAPAGYEFVLDDAVYLRARRDLDAPQVAVEAVVEIATERGTDVPAGRLAAARVQRSGHGWAAGDGICLWTAVQPGPDEAVALVNQARAQLLEQLRAHPDLAATAPRWPAVPVFTEAAMEVPPTGTIQP
jgi:hypothetical protein